MIKLVVLSLWGWKNDNKRRIERKKDIRKLGLRRHR